MEIIESIFHNTLLLGVIGLVFIAVACIVAATANSIGEGVAQYQSQFTESAEVELSDVFILPFCCNRFPMLGI